MALPTLNDLLSGLGFGLAFFEEYVAEKKARYPDAAPLWDQLLADVRSLYSQEVAVGTVAEAVSQMADFLKTWHSEAPPSPSDLA